MTHKEELVAQKQALDAAHDELNQLINGENPYGNSELEIMVQQSDVMGQYLELLAKRIALQVES